MSALLMRGTDAAGASGAAKTTQTYIFGVGASGALLAGAGVALISLVGLVSFDVWPGPAGLGSQEEAQLNISGSANGPEAGLSELVDAVSARTATGTAAAPAPGGAPDTSEKRPPKATKPAPAIPAPTSPPAPGQGVGGGGGNGNGNGNGSGSGSGSSGNPGGGNPPTSAKPRNPNARSDPGKPATSPPAHSNGGGKKSSGGGSSKTSEATSESAQGTPGNSGVEVILKPGLGKGR